MTGRIRDDNVICANPARQAAAAEARRHHEHVAFRYTQTPCPYKSIIS
jgi:hypothetical protein